MIITSYLKRKINYGTGNLNINSYTLAFRKSFNSLISLEIGIRKNNAKDLKISDISEMNYYADKFKKGLTIETDKNYVWLTRKYPEMTLSIGFLKKEEPFFLIKDMKDFSNYYRLTIGKAFKIFYPNFYLEYGKTKINTKIDSNIIKMIPDKYKNRFPDLPYNLDRNENYYKFGFSLFIKTPCRTLTQIEYSYIKINRKQSLNYIDYNHILKGKIGYFINRNIILTFGGKLLYRQFNGEIPFLYNKYSQTTFDHPYGWIQFGITFIWD
jgi:hypothetical protein